jgi:hypothetical protein
VVAVGGDVDDHFGGDGGPAVGDRGVEGVGALLGKRRACGRVIGHDGLVDGGDDVGGAVGLEVGVKGDHAVGGGVTAKPSDTRATPPADVRPRAHRPVPGHQEHVTQGRGGWYQASTHGQWRQPALQQ